MGNMTLICLIFLWHHITTVNTPECSKRFGQCELISDIRLKIHISTFQCGFLISNIINTCTVLLMPKIPNRLNWQHACYTHHSFIRTGACGLIVMSIIPVIMPHENKAKTGFTDSLKKNFDYFLMVSSAQKLINFQGNTLNIHPAEFLLRSILLTTQLLRSP